MMAQRGRRASWEPGPLCPLCPLWPPSWTSWSSSPSRLLTVAFIVLASTPPAVDPQMPGAISTPDVRDSLRLVNILIRRPLGPTAVRQECRTLNATEFDRITGVINRAKLDTRIRPNVYDAFAYVHGHADVNAGAHSGPGFLPWHRVFIFLFEKLLRMYDPTVALCYWDSTLEPVDHTASASWSSALFGNNRDQVVTGFAARWLTPLGPLHRRIAEAGRPLTQEDLRQVMQRNTLGAISFPGGDILSNVEEKHNYVHEYVGGLMGQVETAHYDPMFWFHHAYFDCLYEWFRREQRAKGLDPTRDWPQHFGDPAHSPFAAMNLGMLRQIDGQNDFFPDRTFACIDPPGACASQADCPGPHLRCDQDSGRCVSDTLAVRPRRPASGINDLRSLLGSFDARASLNSRFAQFPSRGFNQLFQAPGPDAVSGGGRGENDVAARRAGGSWFESGVGNTPGADILARELSQAALPLFNQV